MAKILEWVSPPEGKPKFWLKIPKGREPSISKERECLACKAGIPLKRTPVSYEEVMDMARQRTLHMYGLLFTITNP